MKKYMIFLSLLVLVSLVGCAAPKDQFEESVTNFENTGSELDDMVIDNLLLGGKSIGITRPMVRMSALDDELVTLAIMNQESGISNFELNLECMSLSGSDISCESGNDLTFTIEPKDISLDVGEKGTFDVNIELNSNNKGTCMCNLIVSSEFDDLVEQLTISVK